jgi:predicted MFS family arabinose efflux permease
MDNEECLPQYTIKNILTRDFVLVFLTSFTFICAVFALMPTLPIFLLRAGSNEAEIGILVGIYAASSLFFRLIVGQVLVRYPAKSIMLFGCMLSVLIFISYLVIKPFWPFLLLRFFQGITLACVDTAAFAFAITIAPQAHRARAIGYFLLATNFALAVAPSFGMFLINRFRFSTLFLTCASLSLCAFIFSWHLEGKKSDGGQREKLNGSYFFFDQQMIVPAVLGFLYNFGWGAVAAFFPLYAIQCGVTNPGYFFSALAAMLIGGRILGGKILDAHSSETIMLSSMFVSVGAMFILTFSSTLPMFIFVGILWGTGSAFLYPASMSYAFEYAGSSDGRAVATFRALTDLGIALGPVVAGLILTLMGYRSMFFCLALIYLANISYFQFYVKKKRRAGIMRSSVEEGC